VETLFTTVDTVAPWQLWIGVAQHGTEAGCAWKVRCMARLVYSMLTSLDGYTEDEHGRFGWGAADYPLTEASLLD
jgi:hypothetical protein